ncbi:MAG: AraC family transcriptional regulator [Flavobacteriaceae bacterium]|nr:MAG: AraC family transcriptional regulator [Flavobacteriaceae bacterium]
MSQLLSTHLHHRKLTSLIENRTVYSAAHAELNIFETHAIAHKVALTFEYPVIASMLTGKKVMHIKGMPSFDFSPGESVVMPADKEMVIDFPLATKSDPTQCLALGIEATKIRDIVQKFNHQVAIENENDSWNIDCMASHLTNNNQVNVLLSRMLYTFTNNTSSSKDMLLDLMLQELIVRLLQTNAKAIILGDLERSFSDTRIDSVIQYIKKNLTNKDITVNVLADKACMSVSNFHKKFKNTLGISPIDYINSEKIKFAKKLMREKKNTQMAEIALQSGFNNTSYFNRQFKKVELMTPLKYRQSYCAE